jgi:hypothetical protein
MNKILAILSAFLLASWPKGAHASERCGTRIVVLHLTAGNIPAQRIQQAEMVASRVLAQADVTVRWKGARHETVAAEDGAVQIDLMVTDEAASSDHPGALGYAYPFAKTGLQVVIFANRVAAMDRHDEVLGHVIAHEIGHVLIGTLEHSPSGVMRAHWSKSDVAAMQGRLLPFSRSDLAMIADHFPRCALEYVIALSRKR